MKAFGNYHPFALLTYFVSVFLVAMFVENPILQLLSLSGAILYCTVLSKGKNNSKTIGFYAILFLVIAFSNPLFSHNGTTSLFFLNGNPVTLEALIYGAFLAVMLISVMLWFKAFSEIFTTDKFLYLFSKYIPKISLVLCMTLRFIPMLSRRLQKVNHAQKAMGLYSSDSLISKLKSTARIFTSMISWALESAIDTSASMKARGYGTGKRSDFAIFKLSSKDIRLLAVTIALICITICGIALKAVEFSFYPSIAEINRSPLAFAVYISFGILAFLPFIIELKEAVIWKYSISKI